MIKKQVYPKTTRLKIKQNIGITEKIDGSNLCIGKLNGHLIVCQRSTVIFEDEFSADTITYKGLYGWLKEHKDELKEAIVEGSVICGEWLGMGKLKYENFSKKYYMFGKARFTDNYDLERLNWDYENLKFCFENQQIPDFIGLVPFVDELDIVTKEILDELYEKYTKEVGRNVEGFVVNYGNGNIKKYVRMKNGKLKEHTETGD